MDKILFAEVRLLFLLFTLAGKGGLLNKSSLEYCGIEGYSLFLREIKCKDYEYFSFHRRISEEP